MYLVGFIVKKFLTMYGHTNVKFVVLIFLTILSLNMTPHKTSTLVSVKPSDPASWKT